MTVKINYEWIEQIEMTAFAMVVQALDDYITEVVQTFRNETDKPQDIAEDVTRGSIGRDATTQNKHTTVRES